MLLVWIRKEISFLFVLTAKVIQLKAEKMQSNQKERDICVGLGAALSPCGFVNSVSQPAILRITLPCLYAAWVNP